MKKTVIAAGCLIAVAVLFFLVGYKMRRGQPSVSRAQPPETKRYEQLSQLFDDRLKKRYEDSQFWRQQNFSYWKDLLLKSIKPLELSFHIEEGKELDSYENPVTVKEVTMTLEDTGGATVDYRSLLLLPVKLPAPGILALHGMGSNVEAMLSDVDYHHGLGMALAQAGFVVLIPERLMTHYEGRAVLALKALTIGTTLEGLEIPKLKSWLNYLQDHEATRGSPAIHGTSIGGYHALLLAALEEEVAGVYVSGWITDRFGLLFRRYPTPAFPAGDQFARTFWKEDLPLYIWDMGILLDDLNLVAAVSPRPLFIETGAEDVSKMTGQSDTLNNARQIYRDREAEINLTTHVHDGKHEVDVDSAVHWFLSILAKQ